MKKVVGIFFVLYVCILHPSDGVLWIEGIKREESSVSDSVKGAKNLYNDSSNVYNELYDQMISDLEDKQHQPMPSNDLKDYNIGDDEDIIEERLTDILESLKVLDLDDDALRFANDIAEHEHVYQIFMKLVVYIGLDKQQIKPDAIIKTWLEYILHERTDLELPLFAKRYYFLLQGLDQQARCEILCLLLSYFDNI